MNTTAETDPVIEAHGLVRTFAGELAPVRALRGVDLTINRGEFAALTGPSGCGKSTLLRAIAGLDDPQEGTVTIDGKPMTGASAKVRARLRNEHLGIVFQFFDLMGRMTVRENVMAPLLIAKAGSGTARKRADELLDLFGLGDRAKEKPDRLSGGEQQRVAIARALANQPTVLLADEPTGSLDSAQTVEILELLRRLNTEHGQTILLVTHDATVAEAAPRKMPMKDGRLLETVIA